MTVMNSGVEKTSTPSSPDARLDEQILRLVHLARDLLSPPNVTTLPFPPPPPPPPHPPHPPPPEPGYDCGTLTRVWRTQGTAWLNAIPPRHLPRIVRELPCTCQGTRLADLDGLADALFTRVWAKLRAPRALETAGAFWFLHDPPRAAWREALARIAENVEESRRPGWMRGPWQRPEVLASAIARAMLSDGPRAASQRWDFPSAVLEGPWVDRLVSHAAPTDLASATNLLAMADRGETTLAKRVVTPAVRVAVKAIVALGEREEGLRNALLKPLQQRIGDVFGATADADWRGLEAELAQVRGWLAREVFQIVFRYLVPKDGVHMFESRRAWWSSQDLASLSNIAVYVEGGRTRLLNLPEVRDAVNRWPGTIRVGYLESVSAHAVVLLQFEGERGPVTLLEGNANTSIRIRKGTIDEIAGRSPRLAYQADFTGRLFSERAVLTFASNGNYELAGKPMVISHDAITEVSNYNYRIVERGGKWRQKTTLALAQLGVTLRPIASRGS